MTDSKRGRGRPKGTTRATIKKALRALDDLQSLVESEDYTELPYDVRRKLDGATKSLSGAVEIFPTN